MSVVAHNGKVIFTSAGKALTYNTLIAQANDVTGKSNKTLAAAIQSLIDLVEELQGGGSEPGPGSDGIEIMYNGTAATIMGLGSLNISYSGTTATIGGA